MLLRLRIRFLLSIALTSAFLAAAPSRALPEQQNEAPSQCERLLKPRSRVVNVPATSGNRSIRQPRQIQTLVVASLNMERLFERPGTEQWLSARSRHRRLAEPILRLLPDVLFVTEIREGDETSAAFIAEQLENRYVAITLDVDALGGSGIAMWVRADLPIEVDYTSYSIESPIHEGTEGAPNLSLPTRGFSVAEIYFVDPRTRRKAAQPLLRMAGVHLKSQRSRVTGDGQLTDKNGFDLRKAEVEQIASTIQTLRARDPRVPFLVAGDFQGSPADETRLEFQSLREAGLVEAFSHLGLDPDDRVTHWPPQDSDYPPSQLDAFVMTPDLARALLQNGTGVVRFRGARPPTDHDMIELELSLSKTTQDRVGVYPAAAR